MIVPAPPLPRYGEASLAEVAPSLLAALDLPGFRNPLGVEPLRRACLLVVDGLGWELLLANRRAAPVLAAAAERGRAVTTGFPATTVSSLASIGTGLPPAAMGWSATPSPCPGWSGPSTACAGRPTGSAGPGTCATGWCRSGSSPSRPSSRPPRPTGSR